MSFNFGVERLFEVHPWKIIQKEFDQSRNEIAESIFSLANEYMGTRGNFEEGLLTDTLEGCYIGGVFAKEKLHYNWKRTGFPTYENSMIHTTNWLQIKIYVDGEEFDMLESRYSDFYRELDMKQGLLKRELIFETSTGLLTKLKWERFLSLSNRHLGAISLNIVALNHTQPVRILVGLDSTKENRDLSNSQKHSQPLYSRCNADDLALLMRINSTGQYYIHRMYVTTKDIDYEKEEYRSEERSIYYGFTFIPKQGQVHTVTKLVSVWTSRDAGYPYGLIPKEESATKIDLETEQEVVQFLVEKSQELLDQHNSNSDYELLKNAHIQQMAETWEMLDVEIKGDGLSQQGIRYNMFQLLGTYRGNDPYLNIGAKGFTGEHYWGRTFWDSESYCLPYYLLTNPKSALNLLMYRYNTLDKARARAKEFGLKGACYPWTTVDGSEDCAFWQYYNELHINAIIPYAIYLYTNVTGDREYLFSKGVEVLIEQARFWVSRSVYVPHRNGYAVNRVTGPDEYQQLVNNNYYTNYMAKWTLEYSLQSLAELKESDSASYEALCLRINFNPVEIDDFKRVASKMLLPYSKEYNVFPQDDMFFDLDPCFREELSRDDTPIEYKWPIDLFTRVDVIKQPDVLMLMFLFREKFTMQEKIDNYRFYEQRTVHGSSLSPCIHSILASEIGRSQQAYSYYLWASRVDLDNFNNNTENGLHISAMAGTWLNIVFGFGGLVISETEMKFRPTIPDSWDQYAFKINYRGRVIELKVNHKEVFCSLLDGAPVKIQVYEQELYVNDEIQRVPISKKFSEKTLLRGVIFDLDGVITDTALCHYLAWKEIANQEGIYFDEVINERLKGISRAESLNVIVEGSNRTYSDQELRMLATQKNERYIKLLDNLSSEDILPGIEEFIHILKNEGVKVAICSASKNTDFILEKLAIKELFDVVITGNHVSKSKPDPEGMLLAANRLGLQPTECLVIEDAFEGIEAANAAGMKSIGIGEKLKLHNAGYVLHKTQHLSLERAKMLF
jgi:alpha,alpha-trehalose phosphorylase